MDATSTLSDFATHLARLQEQKHDYLLPTDQLTMTPDGHLTFHNGSLHTFYPTSTAHSQLAERLHIPSQYYKRLQTSAPQLLADNVNHWLRTNSTTRMLRTLDGQLRAFLSARYRRIEHEEIASVVLPIFARYPTMRLHSAVITETRLYLKAVFSHLQGDVRVGDVVQAGICISNSEVGLGSVAIRPFLFRLVCENGMVLNDRHFSVRHIGRHHAATDEHSKLLTDETLTVDKQALLLTIRDVVTASLDEPAFHEHLARMQEATRTAITGNPDSTVKILSKKHGLNAFEHGSVLRHLIEGGDLSQWGLVNAVTNTAHDVTSYDRATELETLGGTLLHLPAREWQILQHAV